MAESWATFVHNFNESLRYSMKVFSVLNFPFEWNFILFFLVYDPNLSLHANIAVTYMRMAHNFNTVSVAPSITDYNFKKGAIPLKDFVTTFFKISIKHVAPTQTLRSFATIVLARWNSASLLSKSRRRWRKPTVLDSRWKNRHGAWINRAKPGPSFQLLKQLRVCHTLVLLWNKTV